MGFFNTVTAPLLCATQDHVADFRVQFKYGETRQHDYLIGDRLIWGSDGQGAVGPLDEGEPGHKRVVVDAEAERCPICGAEGPRCEVWIENDRIVAVKPFSQAFDFAAVQDYHIVLED